jgi:hypothetical protein
MGPVDVAASARADPLEQAKLPVQKLADQWIADVWVTSQPCAVSRAKAHGVCELL